MATKHVCNEWCRGRYHDYGDEPFEMPGWGISAGLAIGTLLFILIVSTR